MARTPYKAAPSHCQPFKSDICGQVIFKSLIAFFQPFRIVIQRYTYNAETFCLILRISSYYIRHFHTARSAPASPEINQCIVVGSDEVDNFTGLPSGVFSVKSINFFPTAVLATVSTCSFKAFTSSFSAKAAGTFFQQRLYFFYFKRRTEHGQQVYPCGTSNILRHEPDKYGPYLLFPSCRELPSVNHAVPQSTKYHP